MKPKVVVILGPTASGKSDLAVEIARKLENKVAVRQKMRHAVRQPQNTLIYNGAEIISADSRQVYRGLDLGSGKVPRDFPREISRNSDPPTSYKLKAKSYLYKGVRHHLLDVASPRSVFTAQKYQKLSKVALGQILRRGKLPIICGGTGQYIDALINGTVFPEVPPNIKLRKTLEKLSTIGLFARISRLDPVRAKTIDKHNRPRLIRAIEIAKALGSVPKIVKNESKYDVLKIGLTLPREELKKRIKKRLEKRLKRGMVKEVENLHKKGLSWKRLDDFGLEYRYISRYLRKLITYDEMRELIIKESIKYTKRQMTWFKRDKNIVWEGNQKKIEKVVFEFL